LTHKQKTKIEKTKTRELSKRRSKTLVNTCNPQWNQSFVYPGIRPTDLRSRVLEVTVWDYDLFGANEFLGEVCLDLGSMLTTGQDVEPVWHTLNLCDNGSAPLVSRIDIYSAA
jgi:Ca2+-dependent lipid-binding protein